MTSLGLPAHLLPRAFPRERLLRPALVARLQIEGVLLDVLDDVFLLDLALEAAQRPLDGFAFLHSDFGHSRCNSLPPPVLGPQTGVGDEFDMLRYGRSRASHRRSKAGAASNPPRTGGLAGRPQEMRTLVIGGGAREHAIVAALGRDGECSEVLCAPGNAGIAAEPRTRCVAADVGDPQALLALAEAEAVDFTIVGPELPLARGAGDAFAAAGRELFGPSRAAAQLESSKAFAKAFLERHGIPTARHAVCASEDEARDAVAGDRFGFPVVIKADGLAAGKGVTVAADRAAAEAAVREAMVERRFGAAGARVVVEECLAGPEVSFFIVSDGRRALPLPAAQDYKRVADGDRGPNTGGMGAFAPAPLLTPSLEQQVMREIVTPTIEGMRAEGREYRGVLYVGLMLTAAGPKVIEFNVRLGDPEAQVVLPMIEGGLIGVLRAAARGDLEGSAWRATADPHVGVVVASGGYPGAYARGRVIAGLDAAAAVPGVRIVHAGTARQGGEVVTAGGRVLTVVGRGRTFAQAIDRAYEAVDCISFDGSFARRDIGRAAREADG